MAVEPGVVGLPDLAHAALAKEGGHVVVAEACDDLKRHGLLGRRTELFYAQSVTGSTEPAQNGPERPGAGLAGPGEGGRA